MDSRAWFDQLLLDGERRQQVESDRVNGVDPEDLKNAEQSDQQVALWMRELGFTPPDDDPAKLRRRKE
jgi:hypothetical protein